MKEKIDPFIEEQELGDGIETMPFFKEGVLWVWCMICDGEVKVSDSNPVSKIQTYRICKTHNDEKNKKGTDV